MTTSLPTDRPLRILVTRTDRIGDLVLSTSVFKEIRRVYPDSWIAALTFSQNREIIEGNPNLDEVILYDKEGSEKGILGNIKFAMALRKKKFDIAVHLHATNRMHWVTYLAQIPVRIGWNRRLSWALTEAYPYTKKSGNKHEARYNFDILKALNVPCPEHLETYFPLKARALQSFEMLISQLKIPLEKPWVIINPSASDPTKTWSPQEFGTLINSIYSEYDVTLVAIGARKDRHYVEDVKLVSQSPIHDLSGHLTLGMLGHCFKRATLLISNDSGPVHVAQALGVPVISVFVRRDPGLNLERWRPLYDNSFAIDDQDLKADQVLRLVENFSEQLNKRELVS